ncbi:hypothetical protein A2V55_00025 [Candidatus Woesebacteria bacterium RBG_19FT_COMBO_37_29]|uniref:LysM domain-containing protein n=1 Tax=Candidatus Woesebacteria bacterium RBG_19FT_COMBO_37_29 TaxID=1802486 RepID=A0A1F7XND0_9BACT|nr:MAG: hypothetical protein A2V55_00025 [Candidatus Woesebacteria bacterium RBG_19FT_COMBO_37_29]
MVLGAIIIVVVGLLVINFIRTNQTGKTLPITETQQQANTPTIGTSHIVKEGDSLWSIAQAAYGSGYNWVDIARENNINNPNQIEAGATLQIPDVTPKISTVAAKNTNTENVSTATNPISGATYTVEKGDYLWEIAVRAYGDGYKWVEIAKENDLKNPNLIHSGNVLTLPR